MLSRMMPRVPESALMILLARLVVHAQMVCHGQQECVTKSDGRLRGTAREFQAGGRSPRGKSPPS